ncbi:ankyrin repeat-containing protein NPR4 isoform X2 [Cucumis sativus]|uniref:ankyrin repeat-containing protein NPR4 isoform X2 n=1 Tax=Cucumis sativus TaxID=3659 RepID=UPI0012F4E229|nr:ankyrin repeat-containing protein NPR4 isoform X2 [Cucumis sativus]
MGSSIKKDIPIIEQGLTIPEVCVEDAAPRQYNTKTEEEDGLSQEADRLRKAAIKGDWKTANSIFSKYPLAVNLKIGPSKTTALHIASVCHQFSFVEKLVKLTSGSDLANKVEGFTALSFVAASGVVRIAKLMVDKNRELPNIINDDKTFPLLMAVVFKRKDMVSFLFRKIKFEALETGGQIQLLICTLLADYYDVALQILKIKPELAKEKNSDGYTALHVLAQKPSAISSSKELSSWKKHMYSWFNGIYNKALMQTLAHQIVDLLWKYVTKNVSTNAVADLIGTPSSILRDAAEIGNIEFLLILLRQDPQLILQVDKDNKTSIFHIAVENRQESVFSLIYEIGGLKDFIAFIKDDKTGCNILHLAGMLAAPHHLSRVSGAALQMQRELLWFKEVEKIVYSYHIQVKCKDLPNLTRGETKLDPADTFTPRELFSRQHKQLLKDGEEWMKNTANSCMVVATLIATVVFAAAFTFPGGNNDKDGTPIFRQNQAFTMFVITDVAALVLSTTSILTFLSILTSRYAEEDFLMSLPGKLLFGLLTLFLSIACMVVAFSMTFFIAYDKTNAKFPLAIAAVTVIPIGCFCVFHVRLVVDILRSTYWSYFSFRKRNIKLF